MPRLLPLLALLPALLLATAVRGAPPPDPRRLADDLAVVRQRVIASKFPANGSQPVPDARAWMASQRADGSWPDIDYTDQGRAIWKTAVHMDRTLLLATAWADPQCPLHGDATLLTKALDALQFWLVKDFTNPNWWWNEIGIPLELGPTCLMLQPQFRRNESAGCTHSLDRCNYAGWTGANLVWEGEGMLFNALLHNNATGAATILRRIFQEIVVTPGSDDGIKEDWSFFQHGPQLMVGAYGASFASSLLTIVPWTAGTAFQPSEGQLTILSNYLLLGTQPMVQFQTGQFDISAVGREFTRPECCGTGISPGLVAALPGPNHTALLEFSQRLGRTGSPAALTGGLHFYRADLVAHRRPTWYASVKLYSNRTVGAECVNDEGKRSLHLSDGATWLYLTGAEWRDAAPALDWDRLPGTSVEQGLVPLACGTAKQAGRSAFVGGAADPAGAATVAAFDFVAALTGTLRGRKFWALFDDAVVQLGAGFTSRSAAPVETTALQQPLAGLVLSNGTALPADGREHAFPLDAAAGGGARWLHHARVGYVFRPAAGAVLRVAVANQTGAWQDIGASTGTVTRAFARAGVDHTAASKGPQGSEYSLVVVPDIDAATFASSVDALADSVAVLANTAAAQAVVWRGRVLAAVFWAAGNVTAADGRWAVSVDTPCAVVVVAPGDAAGAVRVTVSDPAQDPAHTAVRVRVLAPGLAQPREATVALPADPDHRGAGRTAVLQA